MQPIATHTIHYTPANEPMKHKTFTLSFEKFKKFNVIRAHAQDIGKKHGFTIGQIEFAKEMYLPVPKGICTKCERKTDNLYSTEEGNTCYSCTMQDHAHCRECSKLQKKDALHGGLCADCSTSPIKEKFAPQNKKTIRLRTAPPILCAHCQEPLNSYETRAGNIAYYGKTYDNQTLCHECANLNLQPCACGQYFETWELKDGMCPECRSAEYNPTTHTGQSEEVTGAYKELLQHWMNKRA